MFILLVASLTIFFNIFKSTTIGVSLFASSMLTVTLILVKRLLFSAFYRAPLNFSWVQLISISFYLSICIAICILYLWDIHLWIIPYLTEAVLVIALGSPFMVGCLSLTETTGIYSTTHNSGSTSGSDIKSTTISPMNSSNNNSTLDKTKLSFICNPEDVEPKKGNTEDVDPKKVSSPSNSSSTVGNTSKVLLKDSQYHEIPKWDITKRWQRTEPNVIIKETEKYALIELYRAQDTSKKIFMPIDDKELFGPNGETYLSNWMKDWHGIYTNELNKPKLAHKLANVGPTIGSIYCTPPQKEKIISLSCSILNMNPNQGSHKIGIESLVVKDK